MRHWQKDEIREKVGRLLEQYQQYNKAQTEAEKNAVGDEMKYDDPIIWMIYKHEAYAGSDHAIKTFGELKEHSIEHGGICAKRFNFLREAIMIISSKDILDEAQFPNSTSLQEFYRSDLINKLVSHESIMDNWRRYEYNTDGNRAAKWENYK